MRNITLFIAALLASSAAVAQEGTVAQLTGPIHRTEYPLSLGDRPLVLPNLMLEGTTQFEHFRNLPAPSENGIGLRVGFGIGDLVQLDASSAILVDPKSEWSNEIGARVAVLAFDSRELDFAPSLFVPFDFHDGADLLWRAQVGAETRYRFNRFVYAYGLRDLLQFRNIVTGQTTDKQIQLGLNGTFGVGVSPIEQLSLELDATLFHLKLGGDAEANKAIFEDYIPVAFKALVAVNRQFDVMAKVWMNDLKDGTDSVTFVGGLNARL